MKSITENYKGTREEKGNEAMLREKRKPYKNVYKPPKSFIIGNLQKDNGHKILLHTHLVNYHQKDEQNSAVHDVEKFESCTPQVRM
jgi:hypothetical protein